MEWLCALGLGLVAFAAIGHALWLMMATVVRGVFGAGDAPEAIPGSRHTLRACPACEAAVEGRDAACPRCGFVLDGVTARQLARVRAAEAEVRGLAEAGDLDPETAEAVRAQLQRRAGVLRGVPAEGEKPAGPAAIVLPRPPWAAPPQPAPEPLPLPEPGTAYVPVEVADREGEAPAEPRRDAARQEPRPPGNTAVAAEPPESPKRRSTFAAFMEERNILWGELVGGLLIVGCSIALVVTLWQRLEAIPYFPFALSAVITVTLYGAGQYTLHHWKLADTSRGLLVISLLLAPLNLLLLSDPITRGEPSVPADVGVKLAAVALLAWVVRGGGRDVLTARPGWRWLLALAVVGAPATQLLPGSWFADQWSDVPAWLALGCFAAGAVVVLRTTTRGEGESLDRDAGVSLLSFVGLAAFGLAAAWGLHVARAPDAAGRVAGLALPLALAAVPVVEAGLLVQRRALAGGLKVTGTMVALAGFVAMTGGLAAAWPDPLRVLLVSAAAGLFLTRVAFREALPWAHAGAVPALALAAVVGVQGLAGRWPEPLVSWLGSAGSGAALAGFALVLAALAEFLARRRSLAHSLAFAVGGAVAGLVALFLVSINGPQHPATAAGVHFACAVGLLASNTRWKLRVLAHGGLWCVLVGSLWALHAAIPEETAKWGFAVALEALALAGLALGLKEFRTGAVWLLRLAGRDLATVAAVVAAVLIFPRGLPAAPWATGTFFVVGLTWLVLARVTGSAVATYGGSAAAFLGFLHLNTIALDWRPTTRAVLVAALAHATLATLAAFTLRRQERVFARPLRTTALVATGIAAVVVLIPSASLALQWAAGAAWLGLVWLALALGWRERGTFPAFQVALSLAAVYGGVAWVHAQDWAPANGLGYFEPAALHTYSVSLGLLAFAWITGRRVLRTNATARELWTRRTWSAERVVLAAVVVFQLLLAVWAVLPEARAELTALGSRFTRWEPAALAQAFGPGAWAALAILAAAVLLSWRFTGDARDTDPHLVGLLVLFLAVPVVWAGSFAGELASASALRWGLAAAFVIGSAVVAVRTQLRSGLDLAGFPVHPTPFARPVLLALLAVVAVAVVFLSAQVAELGLSGRKPSGPLPESVFAAMGPLASNLVPLALVVLGLAGTAGRERSPGYAFAGGLVFTATVAAGYALGVVSAGGQIDMPRNIHVWLLACGAAAVWALLWLAAERRVTGGPLLAVQSGLGLGGLAWLALTGGVLLIAKPDWPDELQARAMSDLGKYGWLALGLAAGAAVWRSVRTEPGWKFHVLALAAIVAGVLAACAVQPFDGEGRWYSFHTLAAAWVTVGCGLVVAVRRRGAASVWLEGLAAVLVVMALRGGLHDPWRPWSPAALAAVAAVLVGVSAVLNRSTARVVASVLLANLAATLLWLSMESRTVSGFFLANAAGLAVATWVWLMATRDPAWRPVMDVATVVAVVLLWLGLFPTFAGNHLDPRWLLSGACFVVVLALGEDAWNPRRPGNRLSRVGAYAAALAFALLAMTGPETGPLWDHHSTPFGLAFWALAMSGVALLLTRGTQPSPDAERGDSGGWFVICQAVVAAVAVTIGVRLLLTVPELENRLAAGPLAVFTLALAAALMVRALTAWAPALRFAVVGLGVLILTTAAWAYPDPAGVAPWLQRNAWLFVALTAAGVLGSAIASRVGGNWRAAARSVGGVAAGLALPVLCLSLMQQVPVYDPDTNHTPLAPAAVFAVLVAIPALIVLAVRFALREDLDPLRMPERRRTVYVYLAELLIVLFFVHIRFNVPKLFFPTAVKYWTFTVMALAFVGIGLAEYFERRRTNVLAVPLRRTGVLLPLIPLLAFWAKPPLALTEFAAGTAPGLSPFLAYLEKLPQHFDTYAWLWALAGGLYGLVALSRNSFGWALLAALSTNAALWSLLAHSGVPFFVHPQAWVIPLALIVLVSEHVNRKKLRPDVSNGLRYLGVTMIYVASAADMFIASVGQSVWLPVILAVFCVLGVLAGIMLQVRAFVFLGVGFLVLDIFAMIWHAAVNLEQTWVWYASGIVLGVAILALFAVFEKRKNRGHAE